MGEGMKGGTILWLFIGIILFITILYPIFGTNLRYQVGYTVDTTLIRIGRIMIFIGAIILILGVIMLFISGFGLRALKPMLLGFILIVLGTMLIDPMSSYSLTYGRQAPKGYH
jgi:hypothetical protein